MSDDPNQPPVIDETLPTKEEAVASPAPVVPNFEVATDMKFKPAPMEKRFIAAMIDGVISQVITIASIKFLVEPVFDTNLLVTILASYVVAFFYWVLMPIKLEATPGKKVMGLRIVRADQGTELSIGQMVLRELVGKLIGYIALFIGYLWAFFDKPERRAWHDMIGKTRVVEAG